MLQKSVCLTLFVAVGVWISARTLLPVLTYDEHDYNSCAIYDCLRAADPLESLSRTIDRATTEPQSAEQLAALHRFRGSLWLQRHEPQHALEDFETALRLNPSETSARYGRAECFRQLGDSERADAELPPVTTIDLCEGIPGLKKLASETAEIFGFVATPKGVVLLVGIAWALFSTINVLVGWRQTAEAAGSLWRLSYVAAGLGVLEILPLGAWAALVVFQSESSVGWWLVAGATFISLVATVSALHPPIRLIGTKAMLPRVCDEMFLNRTAELAGVMKVPVPLVRLRPSITGSQQALAFAGCLQAPQIVVSDGILQRLSPAERDAIVAHELGHFANGSLWLLAAITPLTCAIAICASIFAPLSVVVPFAFALGMGLRRVVSRPLERDADLRAARATGFRNTATALAKIHAVNSFSDSGFLPLLNCATATHPSRAMRLWLLKVAAPSGDVPEMEVCAQTVRRHRIATRIAFVVWLLTLTTTLAVAAVAPDLPLLAVPLWIAALTPSTLALVAHRREILIAQRRMGSGWVGTALLVAALLVCPVLMSSPEILQHLMAPLAWLGDSEYFLIYPLVMGGLLLAASTWMRRSEARRKLRGQVSIAFQLHNFQSVLELGKSVPAAVAKDPWLRYHMAFARAICCDRDAAIAEFDELFRDAPRLPMAGMSLSVLLLDRDQAERSLAVAQQVAIRLPRDAMAQVLIARSLRRLGRLDEAQAASDRALTLDPRSGVAHAVAAAIALDGGDSARALQLIDTSLEVAPGEVYVLLIKAEVALTTQADGARAAVEEALAAVRANPLAFYEVEIKRLTRWLAKSEVMTSDDDLVLTAGFA